MRSTANEIEQLLPIIQQMISQAEKEGFCREIKMYRRALVDTDLSILLHHDALNVEKNGSSLAIRMTSALKVFGMVNHTAWCEIDSL